MFRAVPILLLLLLPNVATAQTVIGIGGETCGSWKVDRKEGSADNVAAYSYVAGYMSAMNFTYFVEHKNDYVKGTDLNGMIGWIDNYCNAHPLDIVAIALIQLHNEMIKRFK